MSKFNTYQAHHLNKVNIIGGYNRNNIHISGTSICSDRQTHYEPLAHAQ